MFCRNCGNQCGDNDNVCNRCGTRLKAAPAAPKTTGTSGFDLKPYVSYIALGIAALALVFAIVNLFGTYEVSCSSGLFGTQTFKMSVSDLYKYSTMLQIANIMHGVFMIAVAAVAGLYGMKELIGMPYYDQCIEKLPFADFPIGNLSIAKNPLTLIGSVAAISGILQALMYLIGKFEIYWSSYRASVHWSTWIIIMVGVALAIVDIFLLSKKSAE